MLWELHTHTYEVSYCSNISAKELVEKHIEKGYTGIVVTDHYTKDYFSSLGNLSLKEQVDEYLRGYRLAKKTAGDDLIVLLGMEIRFPENMNDYLVFGVDEDFLYDNLELYNLGYVKFKKLCDEKGYILIQAHPFRAGMVRANTKYLHGIEVHNGHPWHDSRNELALEFANDNNVEIHTYGSDVHNLEHIGTGSVITEFNIQNSNDLLTVLKNNSFSLKICQ